MCYICNDSISWIVVIKKRLLEGYWNFGYSFSGSTSEELFVHWTMQGNRNQNLKKICSRVYLYFMEYVVHRRLTFGFLKPVTILWLKWFFWGFFCFVFLKWVPLRNLGEGCFLGSNESVSILACPEILLAKLTRQGLKYFFCLFVFNSFWDWGCSPRAGFWYRDNRTYLWLLRKEGD